MAPPVSALHPPVWGIFLIPLGIGFTPPSPYEPYIRLIPPFFIPQGMKLVLYPSYPLLPSFARTLQLFVIENPNAVVVLP